MKGVRQNFKTTPSTKDFNTLLVTWNIIIWHWIFSWCLILRSVLSRIKLNNLWVFFLITTLEIGVTRGVFIFISDRSSMRWSVSLFNLVSTTVVKGWKKHCSTSQFFSFQEVAFCAFKRKWVDTKTLKIWDRIFQISFADWTDNFLRLRLIPRLNW